jgi:hypothetical protein
MALCAASPADDPSSHRITALFVVIHLRPTFRLGSSPDFNNS